MYLGLTRTCVSECVHILFTPGRCTATRPRSLTRTQLPVSSILGTGSVGFWVCNGHTGGWFVELGLLRLPLGLTPYAGNTY